QIYFQRVQKKSYKDKEYIFIPKKGGRQKQHIPIKKFKILKRNQLKSYLKENNIDLSSGEDPNILIKGQEGNYYRLGLGPFTLAARKEILERLLVVQRNLTHPYDESYQLIQVDRKSTRLNSSHVSISYAVFCLKKKTTHHKV